MTSAAQDPSNIQNTQSPEAANASQQAPFQIHKIYVKECTFELPAGASVFSREWKPELSVQVGTMTKILSEANTHEVTLEVKCEVKSGGELAFKIELKQAGIFAINGLDEKQLHHTLGAFCPNLLYPYARECICDIVMKGGFPQLNLAPINFDALYQQEMAHKARQSDPSTVH